MNIATTRTFPRRSWRPVYLLALLAAGALLFLGPSTHKIRKSQIEKHRQLLEKYDTTPEPAGDPLVGNEELIKES